MTNPTIDKTAGQLSDILDRTGEPIRKAADDAYQTFRTEGGQLISCASARIRQNPVPAVLGAVALGIGIGCLIASGRNQCAEERHFIDEPLDLAGHIGESLTNSLSRLYANLKFW
jgi:ElaB/YqjD/DUF883 family membrane-anchored ribosome-binding protein